MPSASNFTTTLPTVIFYHTFQSRHLSLVAWTTVIQCHATYSSEFSLYRTPLPDWLIHYICSAGITLAAHSTPCGLRAGNTLTLKKLHSCTPSYLPDVYQLVPDASCSLRSSSTELIPELVQHLMLLEQLASFVAFNWQFCTVQKCVTCSCMRHLVIFVFRYRLQMFLLTYIEHRVIDWIFDNRFGTARHCHLCTLFRVCFTGFNL